MKKKISFENLRGLKEGLQGLDKNEVKSQRDLFGRNRIVEYAGNRWAELVSDTIKDPMIWFLVGIGSVFYVIGQTHETIVLFSATIPLILMDAFLLWRTQVSTGALKAQLASVACVIRDGKEVRLDVQDIVPGDIVKLSVENPFLPADGYWEQTHSLQVDESVLTGEAFPILKKEQPLNAFHLDEFFVDTASLGYAGTRVLTGTGLLRVLFTGQQTAYGEIVQSVTKITHERTVLQKAISKLTANLIYVAFAFCLLLALIRYYQGHGWLDAILSAATLAVAAIPEEFPVVFTFFLGVGVYRLAKQHALVRRAVSVENIGRITQICADKTGTITLGQLSLSHTELAPGMDERDLLFHAAVASNPLGTDPVDLAIFEVLKNKDLPIPTRSHVVPFTEDRKRETAFSKIDEVSYCSMKGSPETILAKSRLSVDEKKVWSDKVAKWANEGHKVLAVALKEISASLSKDEMEPADDFRFAGILAFEDPPRSEVRPAMEYCRKNGIKVLMITGDHPDTATSIARDVALALEPVVISAQEQPEKFEELWLNSHPEFLNSIDVVARCNPIQKLNIIKALKISGELVAVTGDGVNDVPALKAADIGIAMGLRGSRSAKEVSSIILADDNFSTIVNAIREGRQLFSNLQMSFEYLLLFHIPFVISAALIPLLGYPLLYLPIHVVWLELIIHPTALFAFQQRPSSKHSKAKHKTSFFSRADILRVLFIGLTLTVVLSYSYITGLSELGDAGHGRAKALALLSVWSAGIVIVFTKLRTRASVLTAVLAIALAVVLIQTKTLADLLHITPLHLIDWVKVSAVALAFSILLYFLRSRAAQLFKRQ